jgi:hypothetical protein
MAPLLRENLGRVFVFSIACFYCRDLAVLNPSSQSTRLSTKANRRSESCTTLNGVTHFAESPFRAFPGRAALRNSDEDSCRKPLSEERTLEDRRRATLFVKQHCAKAGSSTRQELQTHRRSPDMTWLRISATLTSRKSAYTNRGAILEITLSSYRVALIGSADSAQGAYLS